MGIIELRKDMQLATIHQMKEFQANYSSLIFNKESISAFEGMDNIKITIKDNKLLYDIKMNEKVLQRFSKEGLQQVQTAYEETLALETIVGATAKNIPHIFIENNSGKKLSGKTQTLPIEAVKDILEESGLKTDLYEGENWFYLRTVQKEFDLSKKLLKTIVASMTLLMDNFMIVPQFTDDEEDDTIIGIALFFGMDK